MLKKHFFVKTFTMMLLYMYQIFSSLRSHLHFFVHFSFTFMEYFFCGHSKQKQAHTYAHTQTHTDTHTHTYTHTHAHVRARKYTKRAENDTSGTFSTRLEATKFTVHQLTSNF